MIATANRGRDMTLTLKLGCAGLALMGAPAFAQASLSISSEYSSGAYGEATDTTLLYTAIGAGYAADGWIFDATLPWVQLEGPAIFLGPDIPLARGDAMRGPDDEVSGLADLSISAGRTLELSANGATRLDVTGRVLLPTGDKEKGLSTGETRGSLGLDLSQDVGDWTLFAGGGRRFNGAGYEDGWFGSAGLAWTGSSVSIGAAYDFSEASTAGVDAASEISAWVSLPMGRTSRFQIYGVAGLSEGSPDQAIGARIVFGG